MYFIRLLANIKDNKIMKKVLSLFFIITLSNIVLAQMTAIPNANFENRLIWWGLDSGPIDGQVPTANIDTLHTLGINGQNITDLTGIQDFTALEVLYGLGNSISTIDVTQNTNLKELHLFGNQITTIDLSQNPLLEKVILTNNQISSINLVGTSNLKELYISNNPITNLNISQNPLLELLWVTNSQLTSLNFVNHSNLTDLQCSQNPMTSLNISGAPALKRLDCSESQLGTLDLSQNTVISHIEANNAQLTSLITTSAFAIDTLNARHNYLTHLDLSLNTAISYLDLYNNNFSCLNVKNGNNVNFSFFNVTANANLVCIEVDNVTYSNANFTYIDVQSSFSTNCNNICTPCFIPINGTDTRTSCDSLTWIDGITYTSNNNTAMFNIVAGASNGCDSLVSLDLTNF